MDKRTRIAAILFSIALAGLSIAIAYVAITGINTGRVLVISKYATKRYIEGTPGMITAAAYALFSAGLLFGAAGMLSQKNGDRFMTYFKWASIAAGVTMVGSLFFN